MDVRVATVPFQLVISKDHAAESLVVMPISWMLLVW